jgi:transcriptional regulator with XRE-family HTH domain
MKARIPLNLVGPTIRALRSRRHWTQADLALRLQLAGWNISRSGIAKIEAHRVHVDDRELWFLGHVLHATVSDLFPPRNPHKTIREALAEVLGADSADELVPA